MSAPSTRWYVSVRSPYSWLALHDARQERLDLLRESEMRVFFEPEASSGSTARERSAVFHYTPMSRVKHLYILRDVARLSRSRGLAVTWPRDPHPRWEISALALAAALAQDQDSGKHLAAELADARWLRGEDVHLEATVAGCLQRCGLDPALARLYLSDQGDLLRQTVLARLDEDGVFGVPLIVVGREPFWGIDRLESAALAHSRRTADGITSVSDDHAATVPVDDHPGGCG